MTLVHQLTELNYLHVNYRPFKKWAIFQEMMGVSEDEKGCSEIIIPLRFLSISHLWEKHLSCRIIYQMLFFTI